MAKKIIISSLLFAGLISLSDLSAVAISTSENYVINSDSVNFVGGDSSSVSYELRGTGGEIATGQSSSDSYILNAGYQAMSGGSLSVTLPASSNISLAPDVDVQTGGQANSSPSWLVSGSSGYSLNLKKGATFAGEYGVVDGDSRQFILDYYSVVTYDWSVPEGYSAFGFSPEGDHVVTAYHDDGDSCGSGTGLGNCWQATGNPDLSDGDRDWPNRLVSRTTSQASNSETTINFRMEIPAGTYLADQFETSIFITILPQ